MENKKEIKLIFANPLTIQHDTRVLTVEGFSSIATTFQNNDLNIIVMNAHLEDFYCEVLLHELNEIEISKAIDKCIKESNPKAFSNCCHFMNSLSLNQYQTLTFPLKPFSEYIESDILPQLEDSTSLKEDSELVKEAFSEELKEKEDRIGVGKQKERILLPRPKKEERKLNATEKEIEILSCLASNGFSRQERGKYLRNIRLQLKAERNSQIKRKEVK